MVNAENIRKVITMIEDERNHFDMNDWYTENSEIIYPPNVCGTPSCIGGWAESIMRFEKKLKKNDYYYIPSNKVGEWLGLTYVQGRDLFFPRDETLADSDNSAYKATRQQAVAHLEHIIETDEVNWAKFV